MASVYAGGWRPFSLDLRCTGRSVLDSDRFILLLANQNASFRCIFLCVSFYLLRDENLAPISVFPCFTVYQWSGNLSSDRLLCPAQQEEAVSKISKIRRKENENDGIDSFDAPRGADLADSQ